MNQTVIALGFFDGVHRGHGALLEKTVQRARELGAEPVVFTFDRPPKEVVTGKPVLLINSPEDRRGLVKRLYGIERIILAPFDREMMTLPWDAFVEQKLVRDMHAVHLVAGHDHRFGHKNQGTPQLLQEKCRELGLGCDIIPKVEVDGITVSSTYIRQLVESGDVETAARFLGHRHCMTQTVGHGQRLGRTIGIPTVNLAVPEHVLTPKFGVYVSRVYLPDGRSCAGVTNVGTRPTVSRGEAVSVETFLLDFDGDLYGQDIRLEFCKRLRGEVKFDSLEALREEIQKNIRQTRAYFEENGVCYHHILDPHTGCPAESGVKSVSVVAQDDTLADALSTALFVMGLDAGAEFQKSSGLAFEAVFVTDDNTVWITPGLAGRYRSDRPYQILE